MKRSLRIVAFLLVAVMLVSTFSVIGLAAMPVDGLSGKTIVALGDSLTAFKSSNGYTYVDYLQNEIGVDIINSGVGGDTTNHVMERFDEDVMAYSPDLVIFCIGMNDQATVIAENAPLTALDEYIQNVSYFVETIQAQGGEVLFVTPNPVLEADGKYTPGEYGLNYNGGNLPVFCNAFRELAVKYDSNIVDLNLEFVKDINSLSDLISDGIHQTDLGRQLFTYHIKNHLDAIYDGENKATMTVNCVDKEGNLLDSYTISGYAGANITLPSPELEGYKTTDDIVTTFVDGAVHTYTYEITLQGYIEEAESILACDYDTAVLAQIVEAYEEAKALSADEDAAIEDVLACSLKLGKLLSLKNGAEYVVSNGASYTTTEPNRVGYDDAHCDDGIRLTDGVKGVASGENASYSSWDGASVEVVIDLGSKQSFDLARIYAAANKYWDIGKPASVKVSIDNGDGYEEVASSIGIKTENIGTEWVTYTVTAFTDTPVSAQKVKLDVTFNGNCVWIDEAEIALRTSKPKDIIFINKMNENVSAGDSVVFTPAFGQISGDVSEGNIAWTTNILAKAAGDGKYTVVSVSDGIGSTTPAVNLNSDEILIAVHEWKDDVEQSYYNRELARMLTAGMTIELSGVDAAGATLGIASYAKAVDVVFDETVGEGDSLFVTHFNATDPEGAGVIFTETYTGCEWWLHVAFAPVAGEENVYEVTAMKNGMASGNATPIDIPEGGFVYAVNTGNNWEELTAGLTGTGTTWYDYPQYLTRPNYKSVAVEAAVALAKTWSVGKQYVISGLDLVNKVIPTSTPYTDWFNAAYVSTATIKAFGDSGSTTPSEPTPVYENTFWVTHFDDMYSEGAGSIYTTTDIGGGWWLHVAFAPVEGTEPYEIVEISNGLANGSGKALSVPAGGFVWAANYGNNYPAINGSGINFTSPASKSAIDIAAQWKVGDRFVFTGLDLVNKTIPTTTPALDWYSEYYVCTATFEVYAPETDDSSENVSEEPSIDDSSDDTSDDPSVDPEPEIMRGDVDGNGEIDQYDYLLVKRAYFETYALDEQAAQRADVDQSGEVDQMDYLYIKRHYFGTYTIG